MVDQCSSGVGGLGTPFVPPVDPREGIIVRHQQGITNGNAIVQLEENGKIVYELQDLVIEFPEVAFSSDAPAATEVGDTVATVNYNGLITEKTYPIVTRQIVPDPGGLDLNIAFNFQKTNVKSNVAGVAEAHTVTAIDNQGNQTSVQAGVPFKHAFYQGFNINNALSQTEIKALQNKYLLDNVFKQFVSGKAYTYVIPSSPLANQYIYWCGPVSTPVITAAELNGLPFPITQLSNVNVTNIYDGALIIEYWVVRSSNKFGPNGSLDIKVYQ